jgi:hypothetical protein
MKSFKNFITEEVTTQQLNDLERILDNAFKDTGLDIEWTKHFKERINDARNKPAITIDELREIFIKSLAKYKDKYKKMYDGFEAVLFDAQSKVNLPFVINYDRRSDEFDLVTKTIMRKADFKTSTEKLIVK